MRTQSIGPKDTAESRLIGFDFTAELDVGETITAVNSITASVVSGTDASPGNIISGVPTIAGALVKQRVVAGVSKVTYHLRCVVATSAGNILTIAGNLPALTL